LNPHSPCGEQDFKSGVSTSSTIRASCVLPRYHLADERCPKTRKGKKKGVRYHTFSLGAEDRARTGHPDLGKVVLYQMSYFRMISKELPVCVGSAKIGIFLFQQNLKSSL
jgi:hypothetical protein